MIGRFRRLTRAHKIVVALSVVIAVLTAMALIPWERFDDFHEAVVSPALAASKGERRLGVIAPSYDWRVNNCRERAGVDWPGHWRCDVRTVDPVCSGSYSSTCTSKITAQPTSGTSRTRSRAARLGARLGR
jgi:hypothetical protein